jgi:Neutral/alkaline non-lysosomal ceramidase, N-terminal
VSRLTALLALCALLPVASPAAAQIQRELRVGVAEADVTPPIGTPLGGYGGRISPRPDLNPFNYHALFRPSTGVRDPIEAQALVLEQGDELVVLLTLDAIGVERALIEDVAREARRRGVPLSGERLVVAASHTHSGPGALSRRLIWQLGAVDRFNRRVHRGFVDATAAVITQAYQARRPAFLAWGELAVEGATRNRRAGRSELVEGTDVDPHVRALRVDDAATGEPLAVVVNFAVHGTCLDDDNLEFSADVSGAIRREARERLGYPVLFTNGAEGDVAPSPGGERGMVEVGARVGEAIASLAPSAELRPVQLRLSAVERDLGRMRMHPTIGEGDVPEGAAEFAVGVLRQLDLRLGEPWLSTRFRFTAVHLGPLVWLCVPGEPITAVGHQLRAAALEAGYEEAWVLGLSNGHMGYVTTPEEYEQGGYEAWMTFYGQDTGTRVVDALREAMAAASGE